jgi:uncharacterized protein YdiU (UPF0061 family)
MKSLFELSFRRRFVDALPGDTSSQVAPRQVFGAAYSKVNPSPVKAPHLLGWSSALAGEFGLAAPAEPSSALALLAGNALAPGMDPFAACYGGHQFGNWAGQLGDGRAITLGEAADLGGALWEFQLKGAGPTPYSRRADGRAVLRSSIREFVCSEAMFHLGVPTTRALGVVATGEEVVRDMFYDGNPAAEPGAIVCRVSPTFLRFGNFELMASREEKEILRQLADFTLLNFYPTLGEAGPAGYLAMFREICARTALMVAHWMRVGFVHGVMNTDNMSILGLTIDYGPYGWLDDFDPSWTPNTTDLPGRRYCYGRQPSIAVWNLAQLARSFAALIPEQVPALQEIVDDYGRLYEAESGKMMSAKLGIARLSGAEDGALFQKMNELLQAAETDMTIFFRGLSTVGLGDGLSTMPHFLREALYQPASADLESRWLKWLNRYQARVRQDQPDERERARAMNLVNPLYVPRNYLLQEAIEKAEKGDPSGVAELLELFSRPYTEQAGKERFTARRPDWARDKPGCSTLSCSS